MASIVVTAAPPTLSTAVMQDRVAAPSMWTVQAPQSAIPHPNFVPVILRTSRSTHSRGVSPSTSTVCDFPFILRTYVMLHQESVEERDLYCSPKGPSLAGLL